MATRYQQTSDGDAAAKVSTPEARQGQNIKGMVSVLAIGIALVVLAYAVMLALSNEPVTPAQTPVDGATAPAAIEETAPSPT